MKRRHFLQTTAAGATLPLVVGHLPVQAHPTTPQLAALTSASTPTDRVLVVIYLQGGNDGLNTIIPRDQYAALMRARASVAIPEARVLPLTDKLGMHPSMSGLQGLYQDGKLGIVQSVHSANPDGSHFQATSIMFSGLDSNLSFQTGWLGRYLNGAYPNFPDAYPSTAVPDPLAITLGGLVSGMCQANVVNTSIAVRDPSDLRKLAEGPTDPLPDTPMGHEVGYLRQVVASLNAYSSSLKKATVKAQNLSTKYPAGNYLADQLKIVAQLVAGGLQTRIYVCNMGGFDTHGGQVEAGNTTAGYHAALLSQVSEAIAAFQDDLRLLKIEDRVVGMTVSEFGRRVPTTWQGTDHGEAAPVILFGTNINPTIHGRNPDVAGTDSDNVHMQYDFRTLYTSILQDWFGVAPATLKALFPSQNTPAGFPYLPVIKQATPPPVAVGTGDGLTGAYYNGRNFEKLLLTRLDPTLNFNWGGGSPAPALHADQFSVRWTGQVLPLYTEEYTFYVNSDNGRRLWVNDQLIIDGWVDDWDKEYSGKISLTVGQKVNIRLDYFENVGAAYAKLEWASASQARQVVPQSQLFATSSALPVSGQTYRLVARHSGQVLGVVEAKTTDGAGVCQQPWSGATSQQWQIVATPDGYFQLINSNSGKVLDVYGLSKVDGGAVVQWANLNQANQKWKLVPVDGGYFQLVSQNSGKLLDVYGVSQASGANVVQWANLNQANQQWKIELVGPTATAAGGATTKATTGAGTTQLAVFPNPASSQLTVHFQSEGGLVKVRLLDTEGKERKRVADQTLAAGPQSATINVSDLPSGTYYCHVKQGGQTKTIRVVVAR